MMRTECGRSLLYLVHGPENAKKIEAVESDIATAHVRVVKDAAAFIDHGTDLTFKTLRQSIRELRELEGGYARLLSVPSGGEP